jgi:predicted hydrocarbon binding protein
MPDIKGPLRELRSTIASEAGEEAAEAITSGMDDLESSSSKEDVAHWTKSAVERMDELLDAETCTRIMGSCGRNCADRNRTPVANALKRRSRYKTLDEFLEAETRKPPRGMLVEKNGDAIIFGYNPEAYRVRCFCSLVQGLPEGETMSGTYCGCSVGFVERYWEQVLDRKVKVELLESAVAGSNVCRFRVT